MPVIRLPVKPPLKHGARPSFIGSSPPALQLPRDLPQLLQKQKSLESSLLWGILGVTCVTWFNPAAIWILQWLPDVMRIVLLVGTAVLYGIDLVGSYLAIAQIRKYPRSAEANERIDDLTQKLGRRLVARVIRRLEKAHPKSIGERKHKKKTVFAQGCGYQKLFMLMYFIQKAQL